MATIIDQKKDVFSSLGALNILNDGFPKAPSFNSFGSINNGQDSSKFLIDLLKALEGIKVVKEILIDTIVYRLPDLEIAIKDGLKKELKEMVSCSINPTIPSWFQHGGAGVEMTVPNIDFYDLMKVDPTSVAGELSYKDVTSGVSSKDFNTYLYYTIQDPTNPKLWGGSTTSNNMLETTFLENGTTDNNILKFTTSPAYSNKKLTEFNNDYINSISLFGTPGSIDSSTMISLIIETLFGSISFASKKSKKQIQKEVEINEILECIVNAEGAITNNFFEFDNPTLGKMDELVNDRKMGIRRLETCRNLPVKITIENGFNAVNLIDVSTTKEEERDAVTSALDGLADEQAKFSQNPGDVSSIKSNFFSEMLESFVRIIMGLIISPKFITLFAINHQIIYGQGESYDDAKDFMKKNATLVNNVKKVLRDMLLNILLKAALKYLTIKLRQKFVDDNIEKGKTYTTSLLSALGVPPFVIAQINDL